MKWKQLGYSTLGWHLNSCCFWLATKFLPFLNLERNNELINDAFHIVVYNFFPMLNKIFSTLLVEITSIEISSFCSHRTLIKIENVSKMLIFHDFTFHFNYLKINRNKLKMKKFRNL